MKWGNVIKGLIVVFAMVFTVLIGLMCYGMFPPVLIVGGVGLALLAELFVLVSIK